MPPQTSTIRGVTLFYDADCGVCSWLALRAVRAAPVGAVRALPIDAPEARPQMAALSHEVRWASWHVLASDGRLYSAGAAAPALLEQLPRARLLALPLRALPRTTERLYRFGARTRSTWGRLVSGRSVARARRELAFITTHNQSERGAQCKTMP